MEVLKLSTHSLIYTTTNHKRTMCLQAKHQQKRTVVLEVPAKPPKEKTSDAFYIKHLMRWYGEQISMRKYCTRENLCQRSQLQKVATESGLREMWIDRQPFEVAHEVLVNYLVFRNNRLKKNVTKLHEENQYLTEDEEKTVVELCSLLSAMGLGMDVDTYLHVINGILKARVDEKDFVEATPKVVSRLLCKYDNLLSICGGNSINPARVRQADTEVRNAEFVKLANYLELLYKLGKVLWRTWREVPRENKSNMDEVATNAQDHRKKLIACLLSNTMRLFQLTPEGDSKMPMHITLCITTIASGKYFILFYTT